MLDKDLEIVHEQEAYVKEPPNKEYLDWEIDLDKVNRWIQNCLNYQFKKLGKTKFTFTFDNKTYTYTKKMWEDNVHPKSIVDKTIIQVHRQTTFDEW